ncbi:MAG: aminotransferase class V-fold PLP-dependent enzyme, partial [Acidobacteriota bacterium]
IQARQTTLIKRFVGAIGLDERFRLFAARGDLARTGTVSFRLKPFAPRQVETVLAHSYGIHVAAGLHASPDVHRTMGSFPEGTVRISVSWFSSEGDVDRTVAALREIADAGLEGSMRLGARHAGRLTGRAT